MIILLFYVIGCIIFCWRNAPKASAANPKIDITYCIFFIAGVIIWPLIAILEIAISILLILSIVRHK